MQFEGPYLAYFLGPFENFLREVHASHAYFVIRPWGWLCNILYVISRKLQDPDINKNIV